MVALLLALLVLAAGCDYDSFSRPNAPLSGSKTEVEQRTWTSDGLTPDWRITDGKLGFVQSGAPIKDRRAFIDQGVDDVAVEWSWANGGVPAWASSGLVHTDPAGGVRSGLSVRYLPVYGGAFGLYEGDQLLGGAQHAAPSAGDIGRIEVVGDQVRYIHNDLLVLDWRPWSNTTTGFHGVLAHDDGESSAERRKFDSVTFLPLKAGALSVHRLPAGTDMTAGTDMSDQLNAFVAGVPDHSVIQFPRKGIIWVQQLLLENRHGITLNLGGTTLHQKEVLPVDERRLSGSGLVQVTGGSEFTIRNGAVRGANSQFQPSLTDENPEFAVRSSHHGIAANGVAGFTVVDVHVRETWGDCIYLGRRNHQYLHTRRAHVLGGTLERCGRQGIALTSIVDGAVIEGRSEDDRLVIRDVARTIIDLEPNNPDHFEVIEGGVTIRNLYFGASPHNFNVVSGGGANRLDDVTVENLVSNEREFRASVIDGDGGRRRGWKFLNIVSNLTGPTPPINQVIELRNVDDVEVRGVSVPVARAATPLVRCYACTDIVVDDTDVVSDEGSYGGEIAWHDEYVKPLEHSNVSYRSFHAPFDSNEPFPPAEPLDHYASTVLTDEPFLYWRLDEPDGSVTADATGDTAGYFDGTHVGLPTKGVDGLTRTSAGAVRHAGGTRTVRPDVGLNGAEAFSIEGWFELNGTPGSGERWYLASRWPRNFFVEARNVNGRVRLFTFAKFGEEKTARGVAWTPPIATFDEPFHLVTTYDGTTMRLLVNGKEVASRAGSGVVDTATRFLSLGADMDGANPSQVTIDEFALYDHALSPQRVAAHHAAGTAP